MKYLRALTNLTAIYMNNTAFIILLCIAKYPNIQGLALTISTFVLKKYYKTIAWAMSIIYTIKIQTLSFAIFFILISLSLWLLDWILAWTFTISKTKKYYIPNIKFEARGQRIDITGWFFKLIWFWITLSVILII